MKDTEMCKAQRHYPGAKTMHQVCHKLQINTITRYNQNKAIILLHTSYIAVILSSFEYSLLSIILSIIHA